MFFIIVLPLAETIFLSVQDYKIYSSERLFIGLLNYKLLLTDPILMKCLTITVQFIIIVVPTTIILGLCSALLLNQDFIGKRFCRILLLLPFAVSPVANGMMWRWIYHGQFGILNYILKSLGIIDRDIYWISDPRYALWSVAIAWIWRVTPIAGLLLLAALQSIPETLYEAASIDGASTLNRFRYVTLPFIRPMIIIVTFTVTAWALMEFPLFYVLTRGGPVDSTLVINYYGYRLAFQFWDFGLGAALAVILILLSSIVSLFTTLILLRQEES